MKMAVFWDVAPGIALMMEAVNTSETSVNFYQTTRRNIPEDSHLCFTYVVPVRHSEGQVSVGVSQ
jgi:hypothetical protein